MRRLTFLVTIPWFAILAGCGSGGDTQPSAAGGSGGGSGSSNTGGSKSGGSGGSSTAGSGGKAGSGSGGSSGAPSSGSVCSTACSKIAPLDCPNENPGTCIAECEAGTDNAHEMYPECIAAYNTAVACVAAVPQANWLCNEMGEASVGEDDCVAEGDAFLNCALMSGG